MARAEASTELLQQGIKSFYLAQEEEQHV